MKLVLNKNKKVSKLVPSLKTQKDEQMFKGDQQVI